MTFSFSLYKSPINNHLGAESNISRIPDIFKSTSVWLTKLNPFISSCDDWNSESVVFGPNF